MVSPLAVLAEHGRRFITESDPVTLLDMACRTIREETGAALAIAAIFDESSAYPALVLTSGGDREATEHLRSAEVPAAFREATRDGRVIREPAGAHTRIGLPASHPPLTAFLVAPLASASQVHGVLAVASTGAAAFSEDDEHLVRMLADFAGMAYQNAVLINQLTSKAAALQESQNINEFARRALALSPRS